ncbi:MAG: MBOAT family O-acyltransferase [bacterium]|nr:MBOAT family O-acyltransferase [bacterium]
MAFVPWYILILLFLILLDYSLGRAMERKEGARRKLLLIASIVGNLGILFVFKYFNFFNANIAILADAIDWNYSIESLKLILPIGLSFHVFQSLSYVIEVYRKNFKAERHIGVYALYVLFFPQLVAGPIERPQRLLPQLHLEHSFDRERVMDGLTLMLWGFFKKLVIADQLAIVVNQVYGNLYEMSPLVIVIAVILFMYQLYCDFSGYSDIAVGSARVLGFELMRNFERPFSSVTIAEFWRRWHISLSSWLRDYLFFPLAVHWRRWGRTGSYTATIVTFVLIGFWHGAAWTFVGLGLMHGLYLVFGQMTKEKREGVATLIGFVRYPKIRRMWQIVVTFTLVTVSCVFFRARSLEDVWYIFSILPSGLLQFGDWSYVTSQLFTPAVLGITLPFFTLRMLAIVFMEVVEWYTRTPSSLRVRLLALPFGARLSLYYVVLIWIFLLGSFGSQSFIYFQF